MKFNNAAVRGLENKAANGKMSVQEGGRAASYKGVVVKSLIYGIVTMVLAIVTYVIMRNALEIGDEGTLTTLLIIVGCSSVPMFILSLIIAFAPTTVMVCGILYTALQGLLLGALVCVVDIFMPGLALVAVLGTLIVFVVALLLNKVLEVRISSKVMRGVIIAFISLLLVSAVAGVIYAFNNSFFGAYWWIEIIVSAVCIILATIMLMSDLQSAEAMVTGGIDKRYEWNVAFAIVTTLIYIYLEILELLVRIAAIFGRNKN